MSKRGRYGKYGESKRFERLRQSRTHSALASQKNRTARKPNRSGKDSIKQPAVTTRPAMTSDSGFIRDLSHKQFSQYGPYEDTLSQWLESGDVLAIIGLCEGKSVGFAMVGRPPYRSDSSSVWEVVAIAVLPQKQRRGVGTALIRTVMGLARKKGASFLVLHTAVDNLPAQILFRKQGFEVFQQKPHFYPEGQDALMMCKVLSSSSS
jgi:ribosomal-protein-alanine N-acetyltransferase